MLSNKNDYDNFEHLKLSIEKPRGQLLCYIQYPDFNAPFEIHTDASTLQLGAVISQKGKPIAFYSQKMNSAQQNYTMTEKKFFP